MLIARHRCGSRATPLSWSKVHMNRERSRVAESMRMDRRWPLAILCAVTLVAGLVALQPAPRFTLWLALTATLICAVFALVSVGEPLI
jgi:hypothetical protein